MTQVPEPSTGVRSPADRGPARPSRSTLILTGLTVAMVLVPFLFWYQTWFGRTLTEGDIDTYLANAEKPRKAQHAVAQIAGRLEQGDSSVRRWYPQIARLAQHDSVELRVTVAWFMGLDPEPEEFHPALLDLLNDPEPMVRRNAALSLVRYSDTNARRELRRMLSPFILRSPETGTLRFRLQVDDAIDRGTLVARIETGVDEEMEVRSPVPGTLESKLAEEGAQVENGERLALLSASHDHVREALRALYLVGESEDLPLVEPFARGAPGMTPEIRDQANRTRRAILERGSQKR